MIYNYVNLIEWESFLDFDLATNTFFCDSNSLALLLRLYGIEYCYYPGLIACADLLDNERLPFFLLTSKRVDTVYPQFVLPFFEEDETSVLAEMLLKKIPARSVLLIGVSSPKQNLLANALLNLGFTGDIHCFGAALIPTVIGNRNLKGKRLHFMFFLRSAPLRTVDKIFKTIGAAVRFVIMISKRRRFCGLFRI